MKTIFLSEADFLTPDTSSFIKELLDAGFRVSTYRATKNAGRRSPTASATFSDGDGIGYFQIDRVTGANFSTVHIPNRNSGTGYRLTKDFAPLTIEDAHNACRVLFPHWASRHDREATKAWPSFDAYLKHTSGKSLDYFEIVADCDISKIPEAQALTETSARAQFS